MSSSDFRHIAVRAESGKAEKLFRAAVSAFCALTRPSRREVAQVEDLTLPLFDAVTGESRRFVAAALSECAYPPATLVRRLADEPVDIAAPLLMRSTALTDVDLIALISRHGLPHARVIARREGLNTTIADLIRALERPVVVASNPTPERAESETASSVLSLSSDNPVPGQPAENARRRLRSMMRPAELVPTEVDAANAERPAPAANPYPKLLATVLTGQPAFFQTALADAIGISFPQSRSLTQRESYFDLIHALRALDLSEEQAFLITAACFPRLFGHAEAIRLFVYRYSLCHPEAARDRVREWKGEVLAAALVRPLANAAPTPTDPPAGENSNQDRRNASLLRVS